MDSGANKLLESAVQRTLHAHAFSRASSQASAVLTDLLSRYLALLTSTCAKYAHHAGRSGLTIRDAVGAFEDLGLSVEELTEYCATEGRELNRYALYSARRVEDLHEFRSQLADGLRQDRDDAIPLTYQPCPSSLLEEVDTDEEEDEDADGIEDDTLQDVEAMDVDGSSYTPAELSRKRPPSRPTTPQLPLSPISNPSSPPRKRSRNSDWDPPEYVPGHLPPFPTVSDEPPSIQPDHAPVPQPMAPPTQLPEVKIEKPAVQLPQSLTTTAAASDYLVQLPYSQSSLSSTPEWHLPSAPPQPTQTPTRQNRPPIPQIEPSLLAAYHHILTHPPPSDLPPLNPARHKVAMALLQESLTNSRWTPADSVFGSVGPCPPRVATIGPSYPIAIGDTHGDKDKDTKLPPTISRPVSGPERIAPLVGQQTSRIPDLARQVLPPTILARTSRLSHPPVLHRGNKPLTYGTGIPAPWNANAITTGPDGAVVPTPQSTKPKELAQTANGKEPPVKATLPDAKLFATWDYESKDFRVPLTPAVVRGRGRIGSMHSSGSGLISLPAALSRKGTK
ncbi:hypothetical protein CPB84DRAFT_1680169 [Gymnopilus junonius]|uniref:Bromodomain associated domain-containing protein n=1 Tax=Gymnopilus junonius TaxID=109634 RepID=A0A9P5NQ69_GYMJU|nr:hypothetical protein CPB84DRAFT_1680169 [Gymnopilus junonius]